MEIPYDQDALRQNVGRADHLKTLGHRSLLIKGFMSVGRAGAVASAAYCAAR
jgi:hypothetical protein